MVAVVRFVLVGAHPRVGVDRPVRLRRCRRLYEAHLTADLESRARLACEPIDNLLTAGKAGEVDALCKKLGRSSHTRITVILPSGKAIGDSDADPGEMENHKDRPEIRDAFGGTVTQEIRRSDTLHEDRIYVAVPLVQHGRAMAVVRTSLSADRTRRRLARFAIAWPIAVSSGSRSLRVISLVISRRISRPLEEIKVGADRFAAGDLNHRLAAGGSLEVGAVAKALNRMAEQLDERIQTVLRQQNEREAMLSSMEEGVLAIDNQSRILSLNKTCATLLGGEPAKLEGRTVYEVIRKPDLLRFVESALASLSPVDGEIQIHGPQDRWVSAHGTTLYDPQRGKIGVLIVLHDVTRLRHLEEVRRDFVANVSHELRTPITSIKGFIETLLDGAREDKENALRFLQIMLRQVNRLDAIIGDLLSLSRIERGSDEQMIELAEDSIRGVLQAAIETCDRKAAEKQIQIELICPPDLTAQINAALLEQAVINLLDNAIKYSGAGSAIEIRAERDGGEIGHLRQGSGLRHRGQAPAAPLRAVLPRRQGPQPRTGGHRAGPGHRAAHRVGPSRLGQRREHGRRRQHVFLAAAYGSAAAGDLAIATILPAAAAPHFGRGGCSIFGYS